jgi:outer membrane receptor protein involved in Fe transport
MKIRFIAAGWCLPVAMFAQGTVSLPEVTVYSPRVANQSPAGTFAMPVSALRYEPRVDIHARNLAEGQADVTIRGGIFENTGFQVGALTLIDPQTGHYFAEIPIAPAMLTAPDVVTGAGLALGASNSTVGAVTYGWRPVRTAGAASIAMGEYDLRRGEIYQGYSTGPAGSGGARFGADVAIAHSKSDGSIAFGEHEFNRTSVRLQRADASSQTDLFAGYQAKFFGWPNLYTPFNSNETEDLETVLVALNHRVNLGDGQFFEAGAYHRRNKDDYAFNRFAPIGPVHPFQHTTRVGGGALSGRQNLANIALNYRAEVLEDRLESTSLTFGRFRSRTLSKIALVPEKTWRASDGSSTTLKAGVAFEDTSRDSGAFAPVVEIAREFPSGGLRRVFASYTKTSQVPTYTALNSSATGGLFRGNPNLGREKSHNLELGASGNLAGWTADAAVFWRRDDSLVDWTFRRGVTARTANPVDIDVTGFELVARRSWRACDLVIGYTALSKDADYRGAAVDASFYALNYARHRLTAALTARLGNGFELRLDNVARIQADNLLRVVGGDDAITSSVGLAYRPAAFRGFEVAVQVDNLWDTDFQDVPAVPAPRRQFSAGVSYTW